MCSGIRLAARKPVVTSSSFEAWELRQRQKELLEAIEEAVKMAEELTWPPRPIYIANRIREHLVPALFDARTYIEVGEVAAPAIREQMRAIDDTIAGFVRGQASVCLVLAAYYGTALSMIGLESGLLVGLGTGAISFIPYLGAATGLAIGVGIALVQFSDWLPIGGVALIFIIGQTVESYVLTPRLVGDRIGLHPVWIIFALLAGGALLGFTGVLLAVPVAAVIGVLIRFGLSRYLESPLYHGGGKETPGQDEK